VRLGIAVAEPDCSTRSNVELGRVEAVAADIHRYCAVRSRCLAGTVVVVWAGVVAGTVVVTVVVAGAGVAVSTGVIAGTVVEFCTPVVFWLGSWATGTLWATAMAANTSTAIAESAIMYITRFIRSPPAYSHHRFSSIAYRFASLGSYGGGRGL
jgi:hypothetical protein